MSFARVRFHAHVQDPGAKSQFKGSSGKGGGAFVITYSDISCFLFSFPLSLILLKPRCLYCICSKL